jgi:PPK2 family polyphosphate:nucleotide phosphotransferase
MNDHGRPGHPVDRDTAARAGQVRDLLRVRGPVDLAAIDPGSTPGLPDGAAPGKHPKAWSRAEVVRLGVGLAGYQERLYASAKAIGGPGVDIGASVRGPSGVGRDAGAVLLVLQAMDCGGKDGTITSVAGTMNPLGLRVVGFGRPTAAERRHDFLWRIRRALPPPGYVGIFNRSHYEDVLAARVRDLVPPRVWRDRYPMINDFEAELVGQGLIVVKVMLHISYAEQGARLRARLDDPTKRWKYRADDLEDRARWPAYQRAYADALTRCSTDDAAWYVVPADRKWYRNWAVANILLAHFVDLDPSYPEVDLDLAEQRRRLDASLPRG